MKIKKFEQINEAMSSEIKEFIQNFQDSTDSGIIDWIEYVAPKNSEYKSLDIVFANGHGLKKLSEFIKIEQDIQILEKDMEKLQAKKEKLEIEASNETLYKFQEYLLDNDFDRFKEFFMDSSYWEDEDLGDKPVNPDLEYLKKLDIHPTIVKKYGEKILLSLSAHKYNL